MNDAPVFADRASAGKALAKMLDAKNLKDPIVLALPRGGIPVALEVARKLQCPLDLVFVRKIGVPGFRELAAAAVVDGAAPEVVINEEVAKLADVPRRYIDEQVEIELDEIKRRRQLYLAGREAPDLHGRSVIVVDDGIATGTSVKAALQALARKKPKALILAVPLAPADSLAKLRGLVTDLICLETPEPFHAVGIHYGEFHQLTDDEVVDLLTAQRDERREAVDK